MKSSLLLITIVLVLHSAAQNSSPYWSLLGNSNASSSSAIGTTNTVPLRLITNGAERLRIDGSGRIGIGITTPAGKLSILGVGNNPSTSWVAAGTPLITGLSEGIPGNGDIIMGMASNDPNGRANLLYRRSRGTLAQPKMVAVNDRVGSFFASGFDGSVFQNAAALDFLVDAPASNGNVPTALVVLTGTNPGTRARRLEIGSNGNIAFNTAQLFLNRSTGNVSIGTNEGYGRLTILNNAQVPAAPWKATGALFTGFGGDFGGSADLISSMASNTAGFRPVFVGRRSRGSLSQPLTVTGNDLIASVMASPYDGQRFQFPASIDFVAEGTQTAGNTPTRIVFMTGSTGANRKERFSIGSAGTLSFNEGQLELSESGSRHYTTINNKQVEIVGAPMPDGGNFGPITMNTPQLVVNGDFEDATYTRDKEVLSVFSAARTGASFSNLYSSVKIAQVGTSDGHDYGALSVKSMGDGISVNAAGVGINATGGSGGVTAQGSIAIHASGQGGPGSPDYSRTYGVIAYGRQEGVYGWAGNLLRGELEDAKTTGILGEAGSFGVGVRGLSDRGFGLAGVSRASHGIYGRTDSATFYAAFLDGRVFSNGGYYSASDGKLKRNVKDLESGLNILQRLSPKTYEYRSDGVYGKMHLPQGKHLGLIAQEVEKVLPHAVQETVFKSYYASKPMQRDSLGRVAENTEREQKNETLVFKAVNYDELIPVLIKAVQEQQNQIEKLEEEVQNLRKSLGSVSLSHVGQLSVVTPNPVKGTASIRFQVPDGQRGRLLLTDALGRQVRAYNLQGTGTLQLNASTLSGGVYNCTLLINEHVVTTRKMTVVR